MTKLLGLLGLLVISSPARPIETDYRVSIENTMGHQMDFSYTDTADSTAEKKLGSVPGNDIGVFTITSPTSTAIIIVERGAAMPGYVSRKPVTLKADSLVGVAF